MSLTKTFALSSLHPEEWSKRDWQLLLLYVCIFIVFAPIVKTAAISIIETISLSIEKYRIRRSLSNKTSLDQQEERNFETEREALRAMQQKRQQAAVSDKKTGKADLPMPNFELRVPAPRQLSTETKDKTKDPKDIGPTAAPSSTLRKRTGGSSSSNRSIYAPPPVIPQPLVNVETRGVNGRLEEERLLKAQQDFEYQQSILKELEIQKSTEKLEEKKKAIFEKVPLEPELACSSSITLCFRMKSTPSSTTMTTSDKMRIIKRRFDKERHTLGNIIDFLDSLELRPVKVDVDINIECTMNYPKLKFTRKAVDISPSATRNEIKPALSLDSSLSDVGILGDSVVWVDVLDD